MSGAPFFYDYQNALDSFYESSPIHAMGTGLSRYFQRYLIQEVLAPYDITLPDNWRRDYVLYVLFCLGRFAIVKTDRFGIIPQHCGLRGYNVQYGPTNAVIANPLIRGVLDPVIDQECVVVQIQADYHGIMDIVQYYADIMAVSASSAAVNTFQAKLGYVFKVKDKAQAVAFEQMYADINNGKMAAFIDKDLFDENGSPSWDSFSRNLKENYIAGDIILNMAKWRDMFLTDIGIPNANTEKRERLIVDEANANNIETNSKAANWFRHIEEGFEKARKMFGYTEEELSIKWSKGYGLNVEKMPQNPGLGGRNEYDEG